MSVTTHRVSLFAAPHILLFTAILASGACYRAPSTEPQPLVVGASARRFAGVDVVPTGRGGFAIRVNSGMVGSGDPLYVIDGAPMKIPSSRGIDWFKPEDIAQIKVLKYPHEIAEYGPDAVNGVIVITTKLAVRRFRSR